MKKITLETKSAVTKISKTEWKFLFHSLAELIPEDSDSLGEYAKRVQVMCEIVDSLSGKDINNWANKLRSNVELQILYRDGHWLDSPYQYNTKTAKMLNIIYADLVGEYMGRLAKAGVR